MVQPLSETHNPHLFTSGPHCSMSDTTSTTQPLPVTTGFAQPRVFKYPMVTGGLTCLTLHTSEEATGFHRWHR